MRILFFGTPDYTVPFLENMAGEHTLCGVVTAPDRPAGRGRSPRKPGPARWAEANGIPLLQPDSLADPAFADRVQETGPDTGIIIAYGKIIPEAIFSIPKSGCFNLHFSLLPAYRGASPVESVLLNNEEQTGVSMQRIVRELDAGDLLCTRTVKLPETWHFPELFTQLLTSGSDLLVEGLEMIKGGSFSLIPQDPSKASYCGKINAADRIIDWSADALAVQNRIRALSGHRTAFSTLNTIRYFFHRATIEKAANGPTPGTVLQCDKHGFRIACGNGTLVVLKIQKENKKQMDPASFANGTTIKPGDQFG